jgi:hypothetical protein
MRHRVLAAAAAVAVAALLVGSAFAQDINATIRTYQGVSYQVADPSLEVFYTIGEIQEKGEEPKAQPGIVVTTSATTATGVEQAPGGAPEAKTLRGRAQATDITVSRQGVETRIPWDQVRSIRFARRPLTLGVLPAYIPHYRYSASLTLVSGQQVQADYINLGATMVRGTGQSGRIDIPWEDVEQINFER